MKKSSAEKGQWSQWPNYSVEKGSGFLFLKCVKTGHLSSGAFTSKPVETRLFDSCRVAIFFFHNKITHDAPDMGRFGLGRSGKYLPEVDIFSAPTGKIKLVNFRYLNIHKWLSSSGFWLQKPISPFHDPLATLSCSHKRTLRGSKSILQISSDRRVPSSFVSLESFQ